MHQGNRMKVKPPVCPSTQCSLMVVHGEPVRFGLRYKKALNPAEQEVFMEKKAGSRSNFAKTL